MESQEVVTCERVALPRALQDSMKKVQLVHVSYGTIVLILGAVTMAVLETNLYVSVVTAGIATLLAGLLGFTASLKRSMSLHAACLGTTILATWLSLLAYNLCIQISSTMSFDYVKKALVLSNLFVVVLNLFINAMIISLEAAVLYITNTRSRNRGLVQQVHVPQNNIEFTHDMHQ